MALKSLGQSGLSCFRLPIPEAAQAQTIGFQPKPPDAQPAYQHFEYLHSIPSTPTSSPSMTSRGNFESSLDTEDLITQVSFLT
ncbi:hypothetical protein HOY82DRAFT_614440 [Tuber indicum]|nr:hypothetical protein HOY82DRAFT_614440 [Tuber indicum]